MCPLSRRTTTNRDIRTTSENEGPDLGELKKLWRDIASSETRLNLMSELRKKNLGFNEIEKFSLGLQFNLKSEKMKESGNKPTQKIIAAAMEMKLRDETQHCRELKRKREKMKRWLGATINPSTRW